MTEHTDDAEMATLQQKVALLQQIKDLQAEVGMVPNAPNTQDTAPATQQQRPKNVKVSEGRYDMSLADFRTFSTDCRLTTT
jgi:hypothetical protein